MDSVIVSKTTLPRAARRASDSTFDRIFKYYYDIKVTQELHPREEEIRQRWELAWLHLGTLTPKKIIAKKIALKYGVHFTTAYHDIKFAERLFGDPGQQNKAAKKRIISNLVEKAIRKAYKAEDWKAFEKLLLRYDQYNDLNRDENPLADFIRNRKPVQITFSADPEVLKKQSDELMLSSQGVDAGRWVVVTTG